MPLLIVFGGRNNLLQDFTRWDYSTFITFHRWISRLAFALVVFHAVLYSCYTSDYNHMVRQTYIIWGLIGIFMGGFIMVQGLLWFRRNWYEAFLVLHIIFAAVFLLGLWMHVKDIYGLGFYYYSTCLWVLDRAVRLGRICSFGLPEAEVMLLEDECLKVVVPRPDHWHAVPGGHVFVHFLQWPYFWQSHPFTYTMDDTHIYLFCKVKDGVTSTLYKELLRHPQRTHSIRVAVEGSYGESTPASRYGTAVFVAGGNGIPGIYAEALDLCRRSSKVYIQLIWVVREIKSLAWFYEELRNIENTNIHATIYITQPLAPGYGSTADMLGLDQVRKELPHVTVTCGRPSMAGLVKQSLSAATPKSSLAFIACGHPRMVDDLRAAVVANIDNPTHNRLDYFEQLQVWA